MFSFIRRKNCRVKTNLAGKYFNLMKRAIQATKYVPLFQKCLPLLSSMH